MAQPARPAQSPPEKFSRAVARARPPVTARETPRETMFCSIRQALGRSAAAPAPDPPAARLINTSSGDPVTKFSEAFTALNGKLVLAASPAEARSKLQTMLAGKSVVASP